MNEKQKYQVYGTVTVSVTMTVEADSPEAAIEVAEQEYPGLSDYCGNGATSGKLIGTSADTLTVYAGDDIPEFIEAQATP